MQTKPLARGRSQLQTMVLVPLVCWSPRKKPRFMKEIKQDDVDLGMERFLRTEKVCQGRSHVMRETRRLSLS